MRKKVYRLLKIVLFILLLTLWSLTMVNPRKASAQAANVPEAKAIWVDCQTTFLNGPRQGEIEDISFHISADGTMTAYTDNIIAPALGLWSLSPFWCTRLYFY